MELRALNDDERVALIALMHRCVAADASASDDESDHVAQLVEAFGDIGYQVASDVADAIDDEPALTAASAKVVRPEARELIYGFVRESALSGGVAGKEAALLGWLEKQWGIQV